MKARTLSLVLIALRMAVANPLSAMTVWVTETHYTTVIFGHDQYTHDFPQTSTTFPSSSVVTPLTSADEKSTPTSVHSVETSVHPSLTTEESPTAESTTPVTSTSTSTAVPTLFSGKGTYYATGLGACGNVNVDTDYVVALSHKLFDQYTPNGNPNSNTLCGKKINAYHEGNTVQVTVVDRCEACDERNLDFSPTAFTELADQVRGCIQITWEWV